MENMNEKNDSIQRTKIIIIYGPDLVDGQNLNGQMQVLPKEEDDYVGNRDVIYRHLDYLEEYLEDHFKDNVQIQSSVKSRYDLQVYYEIQKLGHICFLESTSYPDDNRGVVYLPQEISDEQKASLKAIQDKLKEENYTIYKITNLHRTDPENKFHYSYNNECGTPDILNDIIYSKSKGSKNDDDYER